MLCVSLALLFELFLFFEKGCFDLLGGLKPPVSDISAHLLGIIRTLWRLDRARNVGREEESWQTSASTRPCTKPRRRRQETAQQDREHSALQLQEAVGQLGV